MGRLKQLLGLEESAKSTELAAYAAQSEIILERAADLERALEDKGWDRIAGATQDSELSREGLRRAALLCRVMNVANPLIKRGLAVRQGYIWGSGVEVSARDEKVNEVVQRFWNDPSNLASFTGDQAQGELETALGTDGNVFLACFTNPRTGRVQVRTLPFDEIEDVITAPGDRDSARYYRRVWAEEVFDETTGITTTVQAQAFYPALGYRPRRKPRTIAGSEVFWDAPVYHVRVNRQQGWKFGVGDAYTAIPWARAYNEFLADWATLVKALSQFAWRLSSTNGSKADKMRSQVARAGLAQPGNPGTVGATAVMSSDVQMEAIPKTGATIDSESGKPLAALVASSLGIPVTMLLGDPGQTGARAVAETLDKPTENEMSQRRSVWSTTAKAIIEYVVLVAIKAPASGYSGTVVVDPYTGEETVGTGTDTTLDIDWPPLSGTDVKALIESIALADGTGKVPPLVAARLLLVALGVEDVDEIVDEMTDDDGNWVDPNASAAAALGNAAVSAFQSGQAPPGQLPEDEEEPPPDDDEDAT